MNPAGTNGRFKPNVATKRKLKQPAKEWRDVEPSRQPVPRSEITGRVSGTASILPELSEADVERLAAQVDDTPEPE